MEDADVVRAELDRLFSREVEAARAALTEAQQRLDDWRRTGAQTRHDVIAAWKLAAANALAVAQNGQDPQPVIDRIQRKALRTART